MVIKLINKLKEKKLQLQNYKNNDIVENNPFEEKKEFDIKVSQENNIFKIEISDYISSNDFCNKIDSSNEYSILNKLCNTVLWNSDEQKINKGIYYIIIIDNCLYNILFTDNKIMIDERIKKDIDEETKYTNITQESFIKYYINENKYSYFSAKHESNGNTYYTKYYNKNRTYSLGSLDFKVEETYDEVNSLINNLENIKNIETILDIKILKEYILKNLNEDIKNKKKIL